MNKTNIDSTKGESPFNTLGVLRRHDNYTTVYIGNMSYKRSKESIKQLFQKYGSVSFVNLIMDSKTKRSKGYAFVQMRSKDAAQKAISELNTTSLDGRTLKVSIAAESDSFKQREALRSQEQPKKTEKEEVAAKSTTTSPIAKTPKRKRDKGLKVLFNFLGK